MSQINAQFIDEVSARSTEECVALSLDLIEATQGVGDHDLDRAQRIARFMEDASSGALDIMKAINIKFYEEAVRQYVADISASPLIQGVR